MDKVETTALLDEVIMEKETTILLTQQSADLHGHHTRLKE